MEILLFFTLILQVQITLAGEVGIDYGLLGDNLPPPALVLSRLQRCGVTHIRLYDPNLGILSALNSTNNSTISLVAGVRNEDLQSIARDRTAAANWVSKNIVPYPSVKFRGLIAGNELIPSTFSSFIVPSMRNLRAALDAVGLESMFVTTAIHAEAMENTFPPSQSQFKPGVETVMKEFLTFQKSLASGSQGPLFVHVYPYFAYAGDPARTSAEYALFRATDAVVEDGDLKYFNLFDAMFDSYVWAIEKIGGEDIKLEVGETGWPSAGNGAITTTRLARTYNSNLHAHVTSNNGTPKTGTTGGPTVTMIFALFNENQKEAGVERNWGLFNPDLTSVYPNPICT